MTDPDLNEIPEQLRGYVSRAQSFIEEAADAEVTMVVLMHSQSAEWVWMQSNVDDALLLQILRSAIELTACDASLVDQVMHNAHAIRASMDALTNALESRGALSRPAVLAAIGGLVLQTAHADGQCVSVVLAELARSLESHRETPPDGATH